MTTGSDRELLELAAKAAGMWGTDFEIEDDSDMPIFDGEKGFRLAWGSGWWSPIADDGDALRLAVRLGIDVLFTAEDVEAVATQHAKAIDGEMLSPWACESWTLQKQDPYAATRRAITRAAASIGRGEG